MKVMKEEGIKEEMAGDEKKFRYTSWKISDKHKHWHFTGSKIINYSRKLIHKIILFEES